MKSWLKAAILLALTLAPVGCARTGVYSVYEERYRYLWAKDHNPPGRFDTDPEAAGRRFRAVATVNGSFEELTSDGFKLAKIEAVPDGGGATRFTFRRTIPEGYHPTNAPMEFTGLYRLDNEADPTKNEFYELDPRSYGYNLKIYTADGTVLREIEAHWTGKVLNWREGRVEETLTLSPDARSVVHMIATLNPADKPVQLPEIKEALRVKMAE